MRANSRPESRHPVAAPPPRRRLARALALFILLALAPLAHAQTTYAWTGAINNLWSTAGNWNPIGVPTNGDSLVFPAGTSNLNNNNDLPVGRSIVQITFTGSGYTLGGNGIVLTNLLRAEPNVGAVLNLPIDVATNAVSFMAAGSPLRVNGAMSGSGPISIGASQGCGILTISGSHSYSGPLSTTNPNCPTLALNGASLPAASITHGGYLLSGNGTIGPLSWTGNQTLVVGANDVFSESNTTTGQLNTGNLSFSNSGQLYMNVDGTTPGASHDQINVTGTVALGTQKILNLALGSSFVPSLGQQFVLINNDGADAISGTFSGRAEGSIVSLNGAEFQLSYVGGTGNDMVLTCTFSPKAWNGSVSALWSNPNNWTPVGVPAPGNGLLFPSGAANLSNTNDLPIGTAFSRIVFTGSGYTLGGNGIVLTNLLRAEPNVGAVLNLPIDVATNAVSFMAAGSPLRVNGAISGSGPISIGASQGCGILTISGSHSYSGPLSTTNPNCPTLALNGASLPAASITHGGYLLSGNGTIGPLSWTGNQTLVVGANDVFSESNTTTGQLNTGNLSFSNSGQLYMNVDGTTPGASHDQINVTGTVALGTQKILNLALGSSFVPSLGQQFVLINNDGADAISGTFSGRAEGSIVSLNGAEFQLSYVGGTGNDMVLTCTFSPKAWNGSVSALWSNPNNWTPVGVPAPGNGLLFPSGAANLSNTNDLPIGTAFSRIVFTGSGYTLGGNGIVLTNLLRAEPNVGAVLNLPIDVATNAVSFMAAGSPLRVNGAISGSGPISIGASQGCGILTISGSHSYSGPLSTTNPNCPTLALNGASLPAASITHGGYLLSGNGTIGPLSWTGNQTLVVGANDVFSESNTTTGQLNTGNLSFSNSGQLYMNVDGTTPGASHDQINVTGTVALGTQKILNLALGSSFVPSLGQQFVLINNDGADAISGTFSGRAEGQTITLGGFNFQFSYVGGTGNDVTLTSLNGRPASSTALASSLNPSNAGQSVTFTATVTGSGATPTGNVTFRDGVTTLGTGTMNGSGVATYAISALSAGNHSITAEFAGDANYGGSTSNTVIQVVVPVYTLTYTAGPNGSISGTTPQQVAQGASGTAVTAVPATGYHFVQWSDASTANPRTDANVTGNLSVTAQFAINEYSLSYAAGANGSISGTSSQTVNHGSSGTAVTAVPDTGYHFVQWSDASTANPRTDANVTGNLSVTAQFAINEYSLSYAAGSNGSLSGSTAQTVNHGSSGTAVTAVPDTGYHFVQWSDASTANPRTDANVVANLAVTASFANDAPVIAPVGDRGVLEDSGTATVLIGVSDLESAASSLVVTAASNDPGLVAPPGVSAGASDGERVISFAPAANRHGGPVTITLMLTDPAGASSQRTFAVTVTSVNDAPTVIFDGVAPHPAATSGAQSVPNFAAVDFGPDDEDADQVIDDFLIDSVTDPAGILSTVDIGNDRTLSYTLTGIGGSATISARVRDSGGAGNGGADTSGAQQFTIEVVPGADLQIAKTNHRSGLLAGESTVYTIVVANAGPNAVNAASLTDNLPATLINASWMCVQALSTATCPSPDTGSGNLGASIDLGVNQYLRFDVMAEVNGSEGAFVTNTATVSPPVGVTALDISNDSATDQDPIVPIGILLDGFEGAGSGFTERAADEALQVGNSSRRSENTPASAAQEFANHCNAAGISRRGEGLSPWKAAGIGISLDRPRVPRVLP